MLSSTETMIRKGCDTHGAIGFNRPESAQGASFADWACPARFIWGAPGIGKSAIVEQFAAELGLPCVCLTGSQLAPEDLIGVPQIVNGTSVFCPPRCLVQKEPFCLFLDELNACSLEVQKAFYSLILERRIGEYHLPDGSIVIGAGNRMQDNAITRQLPSALINRMVHVELRPSSRVWLEWATENGIHPYVYDYLCARPDHLWSQPPKTEEPFSSPRSWHMLSDALYGCGASVSEQQLSVLAYGTISSAHTTQFLAFCKQIRTKYMLSKILSGAQRWPDAPEDRDVLYFWHRAYAHGCTRSSRRRKGSFRRRPRRFLIGRSSCW